MAGLGPAGVACRHRCVRRVRLIPRHCGSAPGWARHAAHMAARFHGRWHAYCRGPEVCKPWPIPPTALRAGLRAIADPRRAATSCRRAWSTASSSGRAGAARLLADRARRRRWSRCGRGRGAAGAAAGRAERDRRADRAQPARRAPAPSRRPASGAPLLPEVRFDRRGGVRQGRRRQIHRGGQPGRGAGAAWACGRAAGRRHLRPQPAAHAGRVPQAGDARRQDAAARGLGAEGDVDRLPGRRGDGDDLARADGDGRAGADDGPGRVGRARRHGGRHAARHRRRAADDGAAGGAGRRGDRLARRRTSR